MSCKRLAELGQPRLVGYGNDRTRDRRVMIACHRYGCPSSSFGVRVLSGTGVNLGGCRATLIWCVGLKLRH